MQTLIVDAASRSYPVYSGENLLAQKALLASHISGQQVLIISNTVVAPLYLSMLQTQLTGLQCDVLILPDGEAHKNLTQLNQIFDVLLEKGHQRNTTLIALGGGVIGDITGFAAACYQRGVNFLQIPTSLLAQVDAAIGGKTAINHPLGKNMIGAFYQPHAVLIDIATLKTLPAREFKAGMAEVIKYALIGDKAFLAWLELHTTAILQLDLQILSDMVAHCCQMKAAIVSADETEQGQRALLNLGHTFGHAIETALHYRGILHGEAVAIGIMLAAQLSQQLGYLSQDDVKRVQHILQAFALPIKLPDGLLVENLCQLMARDKKVVNNMQRLILLKQLGQAEVIEIIEHSQVCTLLQESLMHD